MKKLKSFEFFGKTGRRKYDWKQLLDGGIYELTRGVDFSVSVANFRNIAYGAAARYGRSVRVHANGDDKVVIQGFKKNTDSS